MRDFPSRFSLLVKSHYTYYLVVCLMFMSVLPAFVFFTTSNYSLQQFLIVHIFSLHLGFDRALLILLNQTITVRQGICLWRYENNLFNYLSSFIEGKNEGIFQTLIHLCFNCDFFFLILIIVDLDVFPTLFMAFYSISFL